MFAYVEKYNACPQNCGQELFLSMLHSRKVALICAEIASMIVELRELKQDSEETKILKNRISEKKKELPAFCFQAHYPQGVRQSNKAIASGLTMFDIDHVENPKELWEEITPFAADLNILLAHITPSTQGLRLVFITPTGMNHAEAQQWMAEKLKMSSYDTKVSDLARISFAVPYSYVLFINMEKLFEEHTTAQTTVVMPTQPSVSLSHFRGVPYSLIINRLLLTMGIDGEPEEGERNNTLYAISRLIRYVTDFDVERIIQVVPHWGLGEKEVRETVQSAVASVRKTNIPLQLVRIITSLQDELQGQDEVEEKTTQTEKLPRLPRFLQLMLKPFPKEFWPMVLISALPLLGTLATRVRARYIDGTLHSLNFITCVIAPQGSGKSFTRLLVDMLMWRVMEMDNEERTKEQQYNEEKRKCKNSKKQPNDPRAKIRMLPAALSNTMLFKRLDCADGMHCFSFIEEIESLTRYSRMAWAQKDDILRQSFDGSMSGTLHISSDSWSTMVKILYNLLICGTPNAVYRFFKDVEGGLVSRVCMVSLPDMLGAPIPIFTPLTEKENKELREGVQKLMDEGNPTALDHTIEYQTPKLRKIIGKWLEARRMEYLQTQEDASLDVFRRRAAIIGWRAGIIAFLLNGHKESKITADFALWVASYVLEQQRTLFGKQMNEAINMGYESMKQNQSTKSRVKELLNKLPMEFDMETLKKIRRDAGQSNHSRMVISRWLKNGLIEKIGKNRWKKL